jgi:hypothetical protein
LVHAEEQEAKKIEAQFLATHGKQASTRRMDIAHLQAL